MLRSDGKRVEEEEEEEGNAMLFLLDNSAGFLRPTDGRPEDGDFGCDRGVAVVLVPEAGKEFEEDDGKEGGFEKRPFERLVWFNERIWLEVVEGNVEDKGFEANAGERTEKEEAEEEEGNAKWEEAVGVSGEERCGGCGEASADSSDKAKGDGIEAFEEGKAEAEAEAEGANLYVLACWLSLSLSAFISRGRAEGKRSSISSSSLGRRNESC